MCELDLIPLLLHSYNLQSNSLFRDTWDGNSQSYSKAYKKHMTSRARGETVVVFKKFVRRTRFLEKKLDAWRTFGFPFGS
jgi:hypothetical protein